MAFMMCLVSLSALIAQEEIVHNYYLGSDAYDTDGLAVLDDLLAERNFVFTSELHYHHYSLDVQKKFIAYLSQGNGLDVLGIEGDYATGYEINHFFKTGDTTRLKDMFDLHPEMMVSTETADFYKHYIALKAYRDSTRADFKAVGLDVCYGGGFKGSIFSIVQILNMADEPNLAEVLEEGRAMLSNKKLRDKQVRKWTNTLKTELDGAKPEPAQSIGEKDYAELTNIILNVEQSLEVRKHNMKDRERKISENFKNFCQPQERVFAQFGYAHVFANLEKRYGINGDTFISFLNQDDAYADRSTVVQFMPWDGTRAYFPLLKDNEKEQITPIVLEKPFPQLIDFRNMESVEGSFDFAIIVEGGY